MRSNQVEKTAEVYEKKEVLTEVMKGYQWLLKKFPNEFQVLDAERSIEEVTQSMIEIVESK